MGEALVHYLDRIGLHQVSREADGRVYLKGWDEFDHHSIILREADSPGVDLMAFRVMDDAALTEFEMRVKDWGLSVEQVPAGEHGGQHQLDHLVLADHRLGDFPAE